MIAKPVVQIHPWFEHYLVPMLRGEVGNGWEKRAFEIPIPDSLIRQVERQREQLAVMTRADIARHWLAQAAQGGLRRRS